MATTPTRKPDDFDDYVYDYYTAPDPRTLWDRIAGGLADEFPQLSRDEINGFRDHIRDMYTPAIAKLASDAAAGKDIMQAARTLGGW